MIYYQFFPDQFFLRQFFPWAILPKSNFLACPGKHCSECQSAIPLSLLWRMGMHTNLIGLLMVSICHFFWITLLRRLKTKLPQILNNFSLEQLFSLARLDLCLLAAKDHLTTPAQLGILRGRMVFKWFVHKWKLNLEKYFQNSIKSTSKEQNDLICLAKKCPGKNWLREELLLERIEKLSDKLN
jgi:hypothetical protein